MEISKEGLELIKKHEGYRAEVYLDPVRLPTAGVGHLMSEGELRMWPVGSSPPPEQLDLWLREDLLEAQDAVRTMVRVPLSQEAFDALVSLVFNIGSPAFKKSTLLRLVNQGQYAAAAQQFSRWTFAKGKQLPGLVKRRADEARLFSKGQGLK